MTSGALHISKLIKYCMDDHCANDKLFPEVQPSMASRCTISMEPLGVLSLGPRPEHCRFNQ